MKFEKTEPEVSPIIITLETDMEAQALMAALGGAAGHKLDGDFLFKLYGKLNDLYTYRDRMFKADGQVDLRRA